MMQISTALEGQPEIKARARCGPLGATHRYGRTGWRHSHCAAQDSGAAVTAMRFGVGQRMAFEPYHVPSPASPSFGGPVDWRQATLGIATSGV